MFLKVETFTYNQALELIGSDFPYSEKDYDYGLYYSLVRITHVHCWRIVDFLESLEVYTSYFSIV